MSKPVTGLNTFETQTGPIPLAQLDANFSSLQNAVNDMASYSNYLADSSGAANQITVTANASLAFAYSPGIEIQVLVANTNTSGTVNLNVNSLGNKLVKNQDGSNPGVGQLKAGGLYTFVYDGTNFQTQGSPVISGTTGLFADGTAAAPSISFQSDTGLGLYKAGTDILGFSTAGTQRGTVNASGNWSLNAPASGNALTVNFVAGGSAVQINDPNAAGAAGVSVQISRAAGSTANQLAEGATFQLSDSSASNTASVLQHSGGQTEIWQNDNSGGWTQVARFLSSSTAGGKICQVLDDGGTMQIVGWRGTPPNSQSTNYTAQLSDRGKTIFATASINVTVPANVFTQGDTFSIEVGSGNTVTVVQGSSLTLSWAGNGSTTGNRTLTGEGLCTVLFKSATTSSIAGAGLT